MARTKKISPKSLVYDDRNANLHTEEGHELVNKSLSDLGAGRSILVDQNNKIIAGNLTKEKAEALGYKFLVVDTDGDTLIVHRRTDLDLDNVNDSRARQLAIADNKTAEASLNWDMDQLQADAEEYSINLADWNFEFEPEIGDPEKTDLPDTKLDTNISSGDIIELNNHRLICGSCTDMEMMAKVFAPESIDLLLTDPPYGVSYVGKTKDALTIQNDAMTEAETHELWESCVSTLWRYLAAGASIYATVPSGPLFLGFAEALKVREALRQILIWEKSTMVMGRSDYHYKHEPILYGWKPGAAHYFIDDRTKTSVIKAPKPAANRDHPTMKPVELWVELITNSSRAGDTVCDPFMGSGTSIIASEQTGRIAKGFELDPVYCDVIVRRWVAYMVETGRDYQVIINGEDVTNQTWLRG